MHVRVLWSCGECDVQQEGAADPIVYFAQSQSAPGIGPVDCEAIGRALLLAATTCKAARMDDARSESIEALERHAEVIVRAHHG
jgi:hypothetical protein